MPVNILYGRPGGAPQTAPPSIPLSLPSTLVLAAILLPLTPLLLLPTPILRRSGPQRTSFRRRFRLSDSSITMAETAATITYNFPAPIRARVQTARILEQTWMRSIQLLLGWNRPLSASVA